jgi:hypothetical protein
MKGSVIFILSLHRHDSNWPDGTDTAYEHLDKRICRCRQEAIEELKAQKNAIHSDGNSAPLHTGR